MNYSYIHVPSSSNLNYHAFHVIAEAFQKVPLNIYCFQIYMYFLSALNSRNTARYLYRLLINKIIHALHVVAVVYWLSACPEEQGL